MLVTVCCMIIRIAKKVKKVSRLILDERKPNLRLKEACSSLIRPTADSPARLGHTLIMSDENMCVMGWEEAQ